MPVWLIHLAITLLAVAVVVAILFRKRRERRQKIVEITCGVDLLAQWTYTPDEWAAVAEEFSWGQSHREPGEVYISATAIYFKSGSNERLIDLAADGKVVTYAAHRATEGSPLKIRVRWKVIRRYEDRPDEIKYFKEDYRIPVPLRNAADAQRVAEFFTARLEANLEAYTDLVPDDDPISLFGKDSF